jgi:hypothetical protein
VGGKEHEEAGRGTGVSAWRHCSAAHRFWEWPRARYPTVLPAPVGRGFEVDAAQLARGAMAIDAPDINAPLHVNLAVAGAAAPVAAAAPGAKLLRHYVFQTDCAPDGIGANFNYIKISLFIALSFQFNLVWNPANFVSENTPQYVGGDGKLAFPLASLPADTFTPFGFRSFAPAAAMTPKELFARIAKGELVARPIDAYESDLGEWPMQRGARDASTLTAKLAEVIALEGWNAPDAKERVVLLKTCDGSYRGWDIGGVGVWMRRAFHATRRSTRPSLPLLNLPTRAFVIGVHIRVGDCAFARWKKSGVCKAFPWQRAVRLALATPLQVGALTEVLRCGAGSAPGGHPVRVALVAEAKRDDLDPQFLAQNACTDLVLSSTADPAVASARAVFDALDTLATSDILVLSQSSFSRLAAALAPAASVKLAPFPKNELWAKTSWSGLDNVVEMCRAGKHAGRFDEKVLASVWRERYAKPSPHRVAARSAAGAC